MQQKETKKMQFMVACLDFFGKKSGQSTKEFAEEVKQLTTRDRVEIKQGLEKNGYEISDFAEKAA